jgi:hypothetical protein
LELLDTLYADLDEIKGLAALKQVVYRLRQSFGADLVLRGGGMYALGLLTSDAEAFLKSNDTSLWRGAYLADLGGGWASNARDTLMHALKHRAVMSLEPDPGEAARLSAIALETNPYDRDALALLLRALCASSASDLESIYAPHRQTFLDAGEHLPETWAEFFEGSLMSV